MNSTFDFSDIAPYTPVEFKAKMAEMVNEPGFKQVIGAVMPQVKYDDFTKVLLSVPDCNTFQEQIMKPFLENIIRNTTAGVTIGGIDKLEKDKRYVFLSNHRDIVLDATLLNYCLLSNGFPTAEIAIGNNLLIYPWITDLVRLNKCVIVKRNLRLTKALEAAKQLSAYIHYAINKKDESVWIAQREGRSKDSNDMTQESLIKMLALDGEGSFADKLSDINIVPVSISYEYDPNDYLKAKEFLLRKLQPDFKKSPYDDLLSMETGITHPKGRVHFEIGECINSMLADVSSIDKNDQGKAVCRIIDDSIHSNYRIYPINYIAYDLLYKTDRFKDKYTPEDAQQFIKYIIGQIKRVNIDDASMLDLEFLKEMMYTMYANPLKNKLAVSGQK